jgi:hypothetical protein
MKQWLKDYGMAVVFFIALVAVVATAIRSDMRKTRSLEAYYAQCTYVGSRGDSGWGPNTFYQYKCGGVVEETSRLYHRQTKE